MKKNKHRSESTLRELIPLLPPLVSDSEAIIRSNLATQLVFLSLTIMFTDDSHFMTSVSKANPDNTSSITAETNFSTTLALSSILFLPTSKRTYNDVGYKMVTTNIVTYLTTLLSDADMDVRKAASESLVLLSLHIRSDDIVRFILPVPFRCLQQNALANHSTSLNQQGTIDSLTKNEDIKITCINFMADLASLPSFTTSPYTTDQCLSPFIVAKFITPAVLSLSNPSTSGNHQGSHSESSSFRIRRAIVQAIPRLVSGTAADDVNRFLIPAFIRFSEDDMYRVRKSVGECLVDMSRSFMLLAESFHTMTTTTEATKGASHDKNSSVFASPKSRGIPLKSDTSPDNEVNEFSNMTRDEFRTAIMEIRRKLLVGMCSRLLKDSNKFVRHGMMQFLGPFLASFYPLDGSEGTKGDADGIIQIFDNPWFNMDNVSDGMNSSNISASWGGVHSGCLGPQFFPHFNGMVNRLNSTTSLTPTIVMNPSMHATINCGVGNNTDRSILQKSSLISDPNLSKGYYDSEEYFSSKIPSFIERFYADAQALSKILQHRDMNPPSSLDVSAISEKLIPHFVELATIRTGDENIDAEMRVYCAYSFPAVVLLMGRDTWNSSLKKCFLALITGSPSLNEIKLTIPPLQGNVIPPPVKRCLAASFHTVCQILGSQVVSKSLISDVDTRETEVDLLNLFEHYFLKDPDETTTLNVIRNLPSLLSLLSPNRRIKFLPVLYEFVTGDSMLGVLSKKRSATNAAQLNWRQRDMIAQILPNLIILYRPHQVRQYFWPIVKLLMSDPVSIVREHVEWTIPILLRVYEPNNCNATHEEEIDLHVAAKKDHDFTKLSAEACSEVLSFLSTYLLHHTKSSKSTAHPSSSFSKRQSYCRIVSSVALLIRLRKSDKRKTMVVRKGKSVVHPFYSLNSDEARHLTHVLQHYLLPSCIAMKEDKVANVRQALLKCLRLMPPDIREQAETKVILRLLEEEVNTWDGDGFLYQGATKAASSSAKNSNFI